jgi:hypothetical protein
MSLDHMKNAAFSEICSKHPLTSIEDAGVYREALEILDRLFALDDQRTPAELEYFRRLAQLASEYEMNRNTRNLSL